MKRLKFEATVIIPDKTPVAEAVETLENTGQIAGLEVDAFDVIWQDEDEPDDDDLAAAEYERRAYEQDMAAARL